MQFYQEEEPAENKNAFWKKWAIAIAGGLLGLAILHEILFAWIFHEVNAGIEKTQKNILAQSAKFNQESEAFSQQQKAEEKADDLLASQIRGDIGAHLSHIDEDYAKAEQKFEQGGVEAINRSAEEDAALIAQMSAQNDKAFEAQAAKAFAPHGRKR